MLKVPSGLSWRLCATGIACGLFAACTPLGMWLYEDPRVNLVEISMAKDSGNARLQFLLSGCNTNDYDLQLDSLVMLLVVAGKSQNEATDVNSLVLPSRSSLSLPLKLLASAPDSTHGSTQVPFTLTAKAKVLAPTGPRYLTGNQSGVLTMKDGQPVSWKLKGEQTPCHPGESQLPAAAGRGAPIVPAPAPPPPIQQSPTNPAQRGK